MQPISFDVMPLPVEVESARAAVRNFLEQELYTPAAQARYASGDGFCAEFSRKCGAAGFIGMPWPAEYGGRGASYLERYVIAEELLAARAPIKAHWVADRQSGAMLLHYADAAIKGNILPRIARGECFFCIGLSEPDSGSDMFSARAKATRVERGWLINGAKSWTSHAHRCHYMIALLRTSAATKENRRHGLTQFLIPMDSKGITVNPIENMAGHHDFNDVIFEDVFVPENHLLGEVDGAWKQATGELAYERSGPDRFLETIRVLYRLVDLAKGIDDSGLQEGIGRLTAQLFTLRAMSVSVALMLEQGKVPEIESALVKDVATIWQQNLPEVARRLAAFHQDSECYPALKNELDFNTLIAPKLTIQGGTTEVLRGIIARGLGLR
jgi:acyl-CoA dehydrogenase